MKFIDERGCLFGKINIFDLIVLLAILIAVAGIGYKVIQNRNNNSGQVPVKTYVATVKCPSKPETFAKALKKDKRIYYDNSGFANAKIISIEEVPAVVTVVTDDGKLVEIVDPSLKDVYVDIEIEDKLDDEDIKVGRYAVAVGGKLAVKTIYAVEQDSIVLDIKEK